jgi:predicted RNA methylase
MSTLDSLFADYLSSSGAAQAKAATALSAHPESVAFLFAKLGGPQRRAALALLSRSAKKLANRRLLLAYPPQTLVNCLRDDDPKTRRNTAILLGALSSQAFVPPLIDALSTETQRFVRPSLILALGALGGSDARNALSALPYPAGDDKHAREERDALDKAKSRLMPRRARLFTSFRRPERVWLAPVNGLEQALLDEGRAKGLPLSLQAGYAACESADYAGLFRLRCFYEALLPLGADVPLQPRAFADALMHHRVYQRLDAMHDGEGPFGLRLEMRTDIDRSAFAAALFSSLPKDRFINAPSSYDVELRAVKRGERAALMLRLHGFDDPRFTYRTDAVPASMHPSAAAAILYAHRDAMKPHHRVLDPFCGAGTLLAERGKLMGAHALVGLDLSPAAWRIARANLRQAGLHARVFNRDCRGYMADEKVHEILCNLPFGHRVGSHSDNRKLYDDVLRQWPSLLHSDGFVLAITNDKQLFERLALRHGYTIERRTAFAYGGLSPTCFMLRR